MSAEGQPRSRFGAAVLCAAALVSLAALAGVATAAGIEGTPGVRPGKKAAFVGHGWGPNAKITILIQPSRYRGGNGFGIQLRRTFRSNKGGFARIRFRFPRYYNGCAGAADCEKLRWRPNQRVDINAFAYYAGRVRQARTTSVVIASE